MRLVTRKILVILGMGLLLWHSPALYAQTTITYSSSPNAPLTFGSPVQNTVNVTESDAVINVKVMVSIVHPHGGDITLHLKHGSTSVTLLQKLNASLTFGCSANSINVTFDDSAAYLLDQFDCASDPHRAATGSYRPTNALTGFNGQSMAGAWTLEVVDNVNGDDGTLQSWGLVFNDGTVTNVAPPAAGINDGRINNRLVDLAAPVAIYCEDGFIKVYDVTNSEGALAFAVEATDTADAPEQNTELGSGLGNVLYKLTTGELQVNGNGLPGEEHKQYVFIWQSCS